MALMKKYIFHIIYSEDTEMWTNLDAVDNTGKNGTQEAK